MPNGRKNDSKTSVSAVEVSKEKTTARLFAATPDNTGTRSHPEHSHMQIAGTTVEVQGHLAEMDSGWHHNPECAS